MRWLARVIGASIGVLLLVGLGVLGKNFIKPDPNRVLSKDVAAVRSSLHSELGRDARIDAKLVMEGEEPRADVTVFYPEAPPGPTRKELITSSNIIVRRDMHFARSVEVVFTNEGDGTAAADKLVAANLAAIPTPAGAAPPAPGTAAQGAVPTGAPGAAPAAPGAAPAAADAGVQKAAPAKPKGPTGMLTVVTFPDSEVFRGGRKLGRTPLFNVEVPAGTHLLTLVGDDGAKHRLSVPVKAGKNPPIKVKLEDVPVK